MNISSYDPRHFKGQERRKQVFLVFIWTGIILISSKLIESIFFNHIPWTDILRDFIYGVVILSLMVLVLEKGKTLK